MYDNAETWDATVLTRQCWSVISEARKLTKLIGVTGNESYCFYLFGTNKFSSCNSEAVRLM